MYGHWQDTEQQPLNTNHHHHHHFLVYQSNLHFVANCNRCFRCCYMQRLCSASQCTTTIRCVLLLLEILNMLLLFCIVTLLYKLLLGMSAYLLEYGIAQRFTCIGFIIPSACDADGDAAAYNAYNMAYWFFLSGLVVCGADSLNIAYDNWNSY